MISPGILFAGAALAGGIAGMSTYRFVMVPDLVLRQKSRRRSDPLIQLSHLAWGEGYGERWSALGIEPSIMLRLVAMLAAPAVVVPLLMHLGLPLSVLMGLSVVVFVPRLVGRSVERARRRRIVGDLPDVLGPILESVRLSQGAVDAVRVGLPYALPGGALRGELERLLADTAARRDFPLALSDFAQRVGHPLAHDLARVLTVGFERRLDPAAMDSVIERLRSLRVQAVEEATKGVSSIMVGAVAFIFLAASCLGGVALYGMFSGRFTFF